jgi:gamma-glutamyltranspeptidase/glutathione hydrolase
MDAAVTAAAVLAVIQPDTNGVGGDAFMLNYDAASQKVSSMNASGRAPAAMTLEVLAASRAETDDPPAAHASGRGPHAASVPGAVRGWADALQQFGTISLAEALAPAIAYAADGFAVSVKLSASMAGSADDLRACPAAASILLRDGQPFRPAERLVQADLAATLRAIGRDGPDAFYAGAIARMIARAHAADGGLLSEADLAGQVSDIGEPMSIGYRGYTVYDQPPVSLGAVLLEELRIVEGFDLAALPVDSAERTHLLIEAKKVAFADMEAYLTDPDHAPMPATDLLGDTWITQRRALIDQAAASNGFGAGVRHELGDHTTYIAVVDRYGNAVSWIQSIFQRFGSAWLAAGTGVLMNDRMNGFSVDPGHVNRVAGGKRTAHTLNAPMVFRDERPYLVFGTPGGQGQVQSNLQMLTAFVDNGLDVQAMVEAPRWLSGDGRAVAVESRMPAATIAELERLGHEVKVKGAWSSGMGDAQAIRVVPGEGMLEGAADPRREGYVIGW